MTPENRRYMLLIAYTVALIFFMVYIANVFSFLGALANLLMPVTLGLLLAFVINLPLRAIERLVDYALPTTNPVCRIIHNRKRVIAMLLSAIFVLAIIVSVISILVPQLIASATLFFERAPGYLTELQTQLNEISGQMKLGNTLFNQVEQQLRTLINELQQDFSGIVSGSIPVVLNITANVTSTVVSAFISIVVCIIMLAGKDFFIAQGKDILRATLPESKAERIIATGLMTNEIFISFAGGQLIQAVIAGMLCFIGMAILRIPYNVLISTIIGALSIFPFFGMIIGGIIGFFVILLEDPMIALVFGIFITILMQVMGNVIYPRIVGDRLGMSPLWIIVALMIGNGLFGLPGLLISVPLVAMLYRLLFAFVGQQLTRRGIQAESIDKEG